MKVTIDYSIQFIHLQNITNQRMFGKYNED